MNTTGKISLEVTHPADVVRMDQEHFTHPWSETQWIGLNSDQHLLYTWRNETAELLAFSLFGAVSGDDVAHLYKVILSPEWRGTGEALKFWKSICTDLKLRGFSRVYLEVEASNGRAISFYKKCSFRELRKTKAYYSNGEDAVFLELTL